MSNQYYSTLKIIKDMFWKLFCLEKNYKQKQMKQKVAFINAFH